MARSKVVVPLLLLFVVLSGSWTCRPAAAARPLQLADDGRRWVEQAPAASAGSAIVLPSVWRLWHKLPPLQMKPAGASCGTWSPNNNTPCTPTNP
ncbi:unnamed protein product [Urochloa decumbens]|uniref:Uncharacterized protein n=1 Tax=Urochloa decumbens TaxID=240449 RepID=A0ABC9DFC8_9POAL